MGLESTIVCVDNSDYMRNGDFVPTRLQAQQDAVNLVCHSKTRANPENNVGLLTMSSVEVLATLTTDVGRILSKLHQVQPKGDLKFGTALKVAHLSLKHRQGRNHKMRIVLFVGSPITEDEKELVKMAKKLKKEKVNMDIINFGEEGLNTEKLTAMVNALNGKDGTGSHLVTIPPGPMLSEALMNSPIVVGEDGSGAAMQAVGFEFGVDPNEDPELALALRVSMEEQRARQEDEAKKTAPAPEEGQAQSMETTAGGGTSDEAMLEQALAMSMQPDAMEQQTTTPSVPDFGSMSEEEQIAYAMQMSLANSAANTTQNTPAPMDVDDDAKAGAAEQEEKKPSDEDYSEVMNDPEFLQNVLENLPGVDPHSETIQNAMSSIMQKDSGKKEDGKKDKDKDSK
ncbi:26S proteasome non-ATPase regulatory subunit 4-like [Pecten maximus]|uniref:26S proteasome non-ATPase regulatory subunit 4-like n=1 Tax=Pecten maximus TaxID=6579 RepID=UPI001458810B|nr:26S proteasome non-ATPase regulatory subunit 4-like [Pecten maximus]